MTAARLLECSPDEYHRLPGFSSSLAKILIGRSPSHAIDAYVRKTEDDEEEEMTDQQLALRERGSVLHALVLGKGKRIAVMPYDKYTTKEARSARDDARASGQIPVKEAKMEIYERTATAIKTRIAAAGHDLDGVSEMGIAWTEDAPHGEVECRGMLDHVKIWGLEDNARYAPGAIIYDLKIVGDATPSLNERTAERLGYAIQSAAYTRALAALYPRLAGRIEFRFLFCEPKRPYEMWAPAPDGVFRELGARRWVGAVHAWSRGHATSEWPGYSSGTSCEISVPTWKLREEGIPVDV